MSLTKPPKGITRMDAASSLRLEHLPRANLPLTPAQQADLVSRLAGEPERDFILSVSKVELLAPLPLTVAEILVDLAKRLPMARLESIHRIHRCLKRGASSAHRGLIEGLATACIDHIKQHKDPPVQWLVQLDAPSLERALDQSCSLTEKLQEATLGSLQARTFNVSLFQATRILSRGNNADPLHFILELLQNADDTGASHWKLDCRDDELEIVHNGAAITGMDVVGLSSIGASAKTSDQIGAFGIGFRSVFGIADTATFECKHFCFTVNVDLEVKPAVRSGRARAETKLKLAKRRGAEQDQAWNTVLNNISKYLDDRLLLTLRHIEAIEILHAGKQLEWTRRDWKDGSHAVHSEHGVRRFRCRSMDTRYGRLTVGFDLDDDGRPCALPSGTPALRCGLPTSDQTGLSFWIDGPFSLTGSREAVKKLDQRNWELFASVPGLLAEELAMLTPTLQGSHAALAILPLPEEIDCQLCGERFYEILRQALATREIVPDSHGALQVPGAVAIPDRGLGFVLQERVPAKFYSPTSGTANGWLESAHPQLSDRQRAVAVALGALRISLDMTLDALRRRGDVVEMCDPTVPHGLVTTEGLTQFHELILEQLSSGSGDTGANYLHRCRNTPLFPSADDCLRAIGDPNSPRVALLSPSIDVDGIDNAFSPTRGLIRKDYRLGMTTSLARKLSATVLGTQELLHDLEHWPDAQSSNALITLHESLARVWTIAPPSERQNLKRLANLRIWPTQADTVAKGIDQACFWSTDPQTVSFVPKEVLLAISVASFPHAQQLLPEVAPQTVLEALATNPVTGLRIPHNADTLLAALRFLVSWSAELPREDRRRLESSPIFSDEAGVLHPLAYYDSGGSHTTVRLHAGFEKVLSRLGLLDAQERVLRSASALCKDYLAAMREIQARSAVARPTGPQGEIDDACAMLDRFVGLLDSASSADVGQLLHGDFLLLDHRGQVRDFASVTVPVQAVVTEIGRLEPQGQVRCLSPRYRENVADFFSRHGARVQLTEDDFAGLLGSRDFSADHSLAMARLLRLTYGHQGIVPSALCRRLQGGAWVLAEDGTLCPPGVLFPPDSSIKALLSGQPRLFASEKFVDAAGSGLAAQFLRAKVDIEFKMVEASIMVGETTSIPIDRRVYEWLEEGLTVGRLLASEVAQLKSRRFVETYSGRATPEELMGFNSTRYFGPFRRHWPEAASYPRLCKALGVPSEISCELIEKFLRELDQDPSRMLSAGGQDDVSARAEMRRCLLHCFEWLGNHGHGLDGNWRVIPCSGRNSARFEFLPGGGSVCINDHPGLARQLEAEFDFWLVDLLSAGQQQVTRVLSSVGVQPLSSAVEAVAIEGRDVTSSHTNAVRTIVNQLTHLPEVLVRLRVHRRESRDTDESLWHAVHRLPELEIRVRANLVVIRSMPGLGKKARFHEPAWICRRDRAHIVPGPSGHGDEDRPALVSCRQPVLVVDSGIVAQPLRWAVHLAHILADGIVRNGATTWLFGELYSLLTLDTKKDMHHSLDQRGIAYLPPLDEQLLERMHKLVDSRPGPKLFESFDSGRHSELLKRWKAPAVVGPILLWAASERDKGSAKWTTEAARGLLALAVGLKARPEAVEFLARWLATADGSTSPARISTSMTAKGPLALVLALVYAALVKPLVNKLFGFVGDIAEIARKPHSPALPAEEAHVGSRKNPWTKSFYSILMILPLFLAIWAISAQFHRGVRVPEAVATTVNVLLLASIASSLVRNLLGEGPHRGEFEFRSSAEVIGKPNLWLLLFTVVLLLALFNHSVLALFNLEWPVTKATKGVLMVVTATLFAAQLIRHRRTGIPVVLWVFAVAVPGYGVAHLLGWTTADEERTSLVHSGVRGESVLPDSGRAERTLAHARPPVEPSAPKPATSNVSPAQEAGLSRAYDAYRGFRVEYRKLPQPNKPTAPLDELDAWFRISGAPAASR